MRRRITKRQSTWVYFMQRDTDGLIKIGCTLDLVKRAHTLRREYGRMKLLGIMEGGRDKEQEIHRKFNQFCTEVRMVKCMQPRCLTELFEPNLAVLSFIRDNAFLNEECDKAQNELTRDERHLGSSIRAYGIIDTINMGRSNAEKIAAAYDVDIAPVKWLIQNGRPRYSIEL